MTQRDRVVEAVREGATTSYEVAARCDITVKQASQSLHEAHRQGWLRCIGSAPPKALGGYPQRLWAYVGPPPPKPPRRAPIRRLKVHTETKLKPGYRPPPRAYGVIGREVRYQGRCFEVVWNGGSLEGVSPGW